MKKLLTMMMIGLLSAGAWAIPIEFTLDVYDDGTYEVYARTNWDYPDNTVIDPDVPLADAGLQFSSVELLGSNITSVTSYHPLSSFGATPMKGFHIEGTQLKTYGSKVAAGQNTTLDPSALVYGVGAWDAGDVPGDNGAAQGAPFTARNMPWTTNGDDPGEAVFGDPGYGTLIGYGTWEGEWGNEDDMPNFSSLPQDSNPGAPAVAPGEYTGLTGQPWGNTMDQIGDPWATMDQPADLARNLIPEPTSMALLGFGAVAMLRRRIRR